MTDLEKHVGCTAEEVRAADTLDKIDELLTTALDVLTESESGKLISRKQAVELLWDKLDDYGYIDKLAEMTDDEDEAEDDGTEDD